MAWPESHSIILFVLRVEAFLGEMVMFSVIVAAITVKAVILILHRRKQPVLTLLVSGGPRM